MSEEDYLKSVKVSFKTTRTIGECAKILASHQGDSLSSFSTLSFEEAIRFLLGIKSGDKLTTAPIKFIKDPGLWLEMQPLSVHGSKDRRPIGAVLETNLILSACAKMIAQRMNLSVSDFCHKALEKKVILIIRSKWKLSTPEEFLHFMSQGVDFQLFRHNLNRLGEIELAIKLSA